jgi:hypothetical protein
VDGVILMDRLRQHGADVTGGLISPAAYRVSVCQALLSFFRFDRVSLWRLTDAFGVWQRRGVLMCTVHGEQASGLVLAASEYPAYFQRLLDEGVYQCDAVQADPALQRLWAPHFEPHGIGALLDVVLHGHDKAVGVIGVERMGRALPWCERETAQLRRAAAQISEVLAQCEHVVNDSLSMA